MKFFRKLKFDRKNKFAFNDSLIFVLNSFVNRKKYLFIGLFSGLIVALFEGLYLSMIYIIIKGLSNSNNTFVDWDKVFLIENFDFLINFLNNLSFNFLLIFLIIILLLLRIVISSFTYLNNLSAKYLETSVVTEYIGKIYNYVFSLNYLNSSKYKIGDLAEYINMAPQVIRVFTQGIKNLVMSLIVSSVYIFVLIRLSYWNFLMLLIITVISLTLQGRIFPKIRELAIKSRDIRVDLIKIIVENFQGLKYIYSNGLIKTFENQVDEGTRKLEKTLKKTATRIELFPFFVSLLPIFLFTFIAILYSLNTEKANLISVLGILLISLQRLSSRFVSLSREWARLIGNLPKLDRLVSFLSIKENKKYRRIGGQQITTPLREIVFSDVNFKYGKNSNFTLKNINFILKAGETTAIVGSSGAGKSSILNLLIGLFDPNKGQILVNNKALSAIDIEKWQKQISLVSQDIFLFNTSIINNLRIGIPEKSFEEIKQSCIDAEAHQFIKNLPNGYDTIIGDRGLRLSGGERQRIAIARALLKKSSLLILDEATSSLDSKNEDYIRKKLDKIRTNKIVLIVAHRLSTIQNSDNILVLEKGEIVESGDHKYLLNKNQYYANLWLTQVKS